MKKKFRKIEDNIIKAISGRKYSHHYLSILYKLYRFPIVHYLRLRSLFKSAFLKDDLIQNIYHATVQKTGSQWIRNVFQDPRIIKQTGLRVYPQHGYDIAEFHKTFPRYTFVPGLYIPYQLYQHIKKPKNYKTFYVTRDPRDIIMSWYHSMKSSHRPNKVVLKHRQRLNNMTMEEGISYCIKEYSVKLAYIRSWIYHLDDPDVLFVKFEDLTATPFESFKKIFAHCRINVSDSVLKNVIADYSKDKMRERDLERRKEQVSSYRLSGLRWRQAFTKEHQELFNRVTGDLVDLLGYKINDIQS